jgi:hypothetical protein
MAGCVALDSPGPASCCSQEACKHHLNTAYEHSKPAARKMQFLGHGNGFTFEASPYCSYSHREGVHVLFAGEVAQWPGINAVDAAHDGEAVQCVQRSRQAGTQLQQQWLGAAAAGVGSA